MKVQYKIRKDIIYSEEVGKYASYGIDVQLNGKTIKTVKDVSLKKKPLIKLIKQCNKLNLSIVHIDDVVYDFLSQ